jgi:hypothetical protein
VAVPLLELGVRHASGGGLVGRHVLIGDGDAVEPVRHLVRVVAPQRADGLVHDAAVLKADGLHGIEHVRGAEAFVLLHQHHGVIIRQFLVWIEDRALAQLVGRVGAGLILRERAARQNRQKAEDGSFHK